MKEIRKEFCEKEGYNFIDFETLKQAEKYILFLEKKLESNCCDEFFCNCDKPLPEQKTKTICCKCNKKLEGW